MLKQFGIISDWLELVIKQMNFVWLNGIILRSYLVSELSNSLSLVDKEAHIAVSGHLKIQASGGSHES